MAFNNQHRSEDNNIQKVISKLISKSELPLSQVFSKEDLYLPGFAANLVASDLQEKMKITQLRKIFDMIEQAVVLARNDKFEKAQETLFMVVPNVAYATGRGLIEPRSFNDLIQGCINEKRIKTKDDVETLFRFLQSVVAYKKK